MSQLHDPLVSRLFFSHVADNPAQEADRLCQPWATHSRLALSLVGNPNDNQNPRHWGGTTLSGLGCELRHHQEHDTHLLRITLNYQGAQAPAKWGEMRQLLDQITQEIASQHWSETTRLWGATLLYHAVVPANTDAPTIFRLINDASLAISRQEHPDNTPYGYLWHVGNEQTIQQARISYHLRTLLLITKEQSAQQMQEMRRKFLEPLNSGLASIELQLHKGKHHLRQHQRLSQALASDRLELETRTLSTLREITEAHHQPSHQQLNEIERRLMFFLAYKGQSELLLTSLNINNSAFEQNAQRFHLLTGNNSHYATQLAILKRGSEQLQSDLSYANSTQENAQTITEIQRSMEAQQRERTGYLLNIAAALIAGITIFNSFLDIWALLLDGSDYSMPSPHIRLILSFMAAWAASAGTYLFMKQHKRMTIVALMMVLLAVILAYLSTIWGMG